MMDESPVDIEGWDENEDESITHVEDVGTVCSRANA